MPLLSCDDDGLVYARTLSEQTKKPPLNVVVFPSESPTASAKRNLLQHHAYNGLVAYDLSDSRQFEGIVGNREDPRLNYFNEGRSDLGATSGTSTTTTRRFFSGGTRMQAIQFKKKTFSSKDFAELSKLYAGRWTAQLKTPKKLTFTNSSSNVPATSYSSYIAGYVREYLTSLNNEHSALFSSRAMNDIEVVFSHTQHYVIQAKSSVGATVLDAEHDSNDDFAQQYVESLVSESSSASDATTSNDSGSDGTGGDGGDGGDGGGGEEGGGDGDGEPPRQPPAEGGRPWKPWQTSAMVAVACNVMMFVAWCYYFSHVELVPLLTVTSFASFGATMFFMIRSWYRRMAGACLGLLVSKSALSGFETTISHRWSEYPAELKFGETSDVTVVVLGLLVALLIHYDRVDKQAEKNDGRS